MGVFPTLFLKPMEPAVQKLVEQVQSRSRCGSSRSNAMRMQTATRAPNGANAAHRERSTTARRGFESECAMHVQH